MKQPYQKRAKNLTGVNILKSWLRDVGIKFEQPQEATHDLVVIKADGEKMPVAVRGPGFDSTITYPDTVVMVESKAFTGRRDDGALKELYKVQEAAGFPQQKPSLRDKNVVYNEKGGARKLHYRDEEFLVAIRHNELRRAPNPPNDTWKKYDSTVREATWRFMRGMVGKHTCHEICTRHGYEMADVLTYSRVFVVNFVGRYAIDNPLCNDNERLCFEYIVQRLKNDFLPVLLKKERSVLCDAETVQIALTGTVSDNEIRERVQSDPDLPTRDRGSSFMSASVDPTELYIQALDNPDVLAAGRRMSSSSKVSNKDIKVLEEFVEDITAIEPRNRVLDVSTNASRRQSAKNLLTTLLGKLPHDEMVEALRGVWEGTRHDNSTRVESFKRLSKHVKGCETCAANPELAACLSRQDSGKKTDAQDAAA